MKHVRYTSARGFTLVEVLLLLGIFGLVVSVMIPLLVVATESRMRQQTVVLVEDAGIQLIQSMKRRVHNAEEILLPPIGETGSLLALQSSSGSLHPTIFAMQTGSMILIEGDEKRELTSELVAIENFTVRNTSESTANQSVYITFTVSRTIRLQQPHTYERDFEILITPLVKDTRDGNSCGCSDPTCLSGNLVWYTCEAWCTQFSDQNIEC